MKKRELLSLIKNNDLKAFYEFLTSGGDFNQELFGKSLLAHSLLYERRQFIKLLLQYGADTKDMKLIDNWEAKLKLMDPLFLDMVSEIDNSKSHCHGLVVQTIFDLASSMFFVKQKLSYRNALSFVDPDRDFKKLSVGLHLFEVVNPDFMLESIRKIFLCDYFFQSENRPLPLKKFVIIMTTNKITDERYDIPGLSARLSAFLHCREVPTDDFSTELIEIKKNKELIIGVRFSDERCIRVHPEGEVDFEFSFFESMKTVVSTKSEPVIYASSYTFNSVAQWDHQLNAWAKAFKAEHGYFPNILLASSATYSRIDLVANARGKENLHGPAGNMPTEEEFISMQGFRGIGYELDFCIDDQLGIDTIRLIFDSDPDGGLPLPEEEAVVEQEKIKVS